METSGRHDSHDLAPVFSDPTMAKPVSAVWRVRKVENRGGAEGEWRYETKKVLEDGGEAGILPLTTTVQHDSKSGRLFLSSESRKASEPPTSVALMTVIGVTSPFITVCDPK